MSMRSGLVTWLELRFRAESGVEVVLMRLALRVRIKYSYTHVRVQLFVLRVFCFSFC
jgi:hypothetical protein